MWTFILVTLVILTRADGEEDSFLYDVFPPGFQWGLGSGSYQVEGGWRDDGKGLNIFDNVFHQIPSPAVDGTNGDIACDSYHKYAEDVSLLKYIGAGVYRFSLSWSRILPTGRIDYINPAGIEYYNNLINFLIANGIEPIVTIHHWDLPLPLDGIGGWANDELIHHFTNFAHLVFHTFGDRVKKWVTFNEPNIICMLGFVFKVDGRPIGLNEVIKCFRTLILSHARVYHLYDHVFRPWQGGKVGTNLAAYWFEGKDPNNPEDAKAAENALQIMWGLIASPLVFGYFNRETRQMMERLAKRGLISPQKEFTLAESAEIIGTWDFLGVNHYSTYLTELRKSTSKPGNLTLDQIFLLLLDVNLSVKPEWVSTSTPDFKVVPSGFRRILNWIKWRYGNPELCVLENGYSGRPEQGLEDYNRVAFHRAYINEMLKAVKLDGVNVSVYTELGYTVNFGVVAVNFTDLDRTRTPKLSATCLKQIFKDNGFPR
ncbi:lactase-phlorizin hydrolase [Folsomia candida]|uniref:lactase-phlorizin hydrolase n=1 Tax=Folsomia candida TaxID=158441 RepID=UPI000B9038C0|nr:lactase-phlorizin hydrolase [Folsomia candida]